MFLIPMLQIDETCHFTHQYLTELASSKKFIFQQLQYSVPYIYKGLPAEGHEHMQVDNNQHELLDIRLRPVG